MFHISIESILKVIIIVVTWLHLSDQDSRQIKILDRN